MRIKAKKLLVIKDEEPILEVSYKIEIEDNNQVYMVNGEINEVIGWQSNMEVNETIHIFQFEVNWEIETVLIFKGQNYNSNGVKNGYYQTDLYGLHSIAIAMMIPSYLAMKEIKPTGTYMDTEDLKFIKTLDLLQGVEFKEIHELSK